MGSLHLAFSGFRPVCMRSKWWTQSKKNHFHPAVVLTHMVLRKLFQFKHHHFSPSVCDIAANALSGGGNNEAVRNQYAARILTRRVGWVVPLPPRSASLSTGGRWRTRPALIWEQVASQGDFNTWSMAWWPQMNPWNNHITLIHLYKVSQRILVLHFLTAVLIQQAGRQVNVAALEELSGVRFCDKPPGLPCCLSQMLTHTHTHMWNNRTCSVHFVTMPAHMNVTRWDAAQC